jgi:hypothetical protein
MQVTLNDFVKTIYEYERYGTVEPAFWGARGSLGNYLSHSLDPTEMENTLVPFLVAWESYNHDIDWIELAELWTPNLQQIAHSLSHIHFEDATDNDLSQASELYGYLIQVQGVGSTNASKMLALSLIDLCVMWDRAIKKKFKESRVPRPAKLKLTPKDILLYLEFLRKQKEIANSLIKQCMHMNSLDRSGAISWLQKLPLSAPVSVVRRAKPLAKLLDQYNYRTRDVRGLLGQKG